MSSMSSPSGARCSPRYEEMRGDVAHRSDALSQALAGKDVKDLLLNVGSGGGAAAAPATGGAGAATGGEAAPAEEKEKEEGKRRPVNNAEVPTDILQQRRRSPTTTWALACSTKKVALFLGARWDGSHFSCIRGKAKLQIFKPVEEHLCWDYVRCVRVLSAITPIGSDATSCRLVIRQLHRRRWSVESPRCTSGIG